MTNAEKFLKDGADKHQFAKEIQNCFGKEIPLVDETILDWLADDSHPKLTEDERVILRNAKGEEYIFRDSGNLWTRDEIQSDNDFCQFNHLFQFIKNGEEYSIEELLSGN